MPLNFLLSFVISFSVQKLISTSNFETEKKIKTYLLHFQFFQSVWLHTQALQKIEFYSFTRNYHKPQQFPEPGNV